VASWPQAAAALEQSAGLVLVCSEIFSLGKRSLAQPIKLLSTRSRIGDCVLAVDHDRCWKISGPDRRCTKVRGGLQAEAGEVG